MPKLVGQGIIRCRVGAESVQQRNQLKQLGLSFHNYHDTHQGFPYANGSFGQPDPEKRQLSWRVYLLPYLDEAALYNSFHHDEPWDREHNKTLIGKMPAVFRVKGVDEPGKTSIHVFTGPKSVFSGDNKPTIASITDGTSNTLLAVEAGADKADIWTKPGGLDFDPENPLAALGEIGETFLVLFADGTVRNLSRTLELETLRKLIQRNDGEAFELP